jgi:SAM-dependent methyltransferase
MMKPDITIDTTKPNSARIYDYWLGGTHNYPVDRAAAKALEKAIPSAGHTARLYRYFLHRAVDYLAQSGFTRYLDLATGLPTEGYIHERVAETTKIIYNDIDSGTVAYARQILGDRPNILVMQADLREIDTILTEAEQFFEGERRVGMYLVNVSYFIEDEPLGYVLRQLYNWAAPGSQLAISGFAPMTDPADKQEQDQALTFYASLGTPLYPRTPDHLLALAAPWQVIDSLRPVEEYAEESLGPKILQREDARGKIGYAGILEKTG